MKKINIPRNYKTFFAIITLIAVVSGTIFYFNLNQSSQEVLKTWIDAYFVNNEYNSFVNVLVFNLILCLLIWILGLSVFGSVLISFIYFVKVFILSICVSAIFKYGEANGALMAFLYVFPNQIISLFIYALLAIYSINFSFLFSKNIFNKEKINFKTIFSSYNKVFLFLLGGLLLIVIYQVYLNPLIFRLVFK